MSAPILIVEDVADARRVLLKLLHRHGYAAVGAATLAEAFAQLHNGTRCVLLDLMLPDGDGAALLAHIRAAQMPVRVAVVSAAGWQELGAVERLAPDAILPKPCGIEPVLDLVRRCLEPPPEAGAERLST